MQRISECLLDGNNVLSQLAGKLQPVFLFFIRAVWGLSFLLAGLGKLGNIEATTAYFNELGIIYPHFNAYLVALAETVGGLLLTVGLFSRLVAFPLAIVMIVALGTEHFEGVTMFFENSEKFFTQLPVSYLLVSLFVLFFGPGLISVDALLIKQKIVEKPDEPLKVSIPSKEPIIEEEPKLETPEN